MTTYNVEIVVHGQDNASGPLQGVGSAIGRIGEIAAGILASQVFTRLADTVWQFASGSIQAASNLNESYNKVEQIFGKNMDALTGWAEKSAVSMGLSKQAALDSASAFGVFGSAAGLQGEELLKFGEDNTQLAADLASFYNTSVPSAVQAISSALRGESEPMRSYGVLLDDMSMRQEALSMGIVSTTKNALTPQQRVLAAESLIMKQTSAAHGDFARTSGGLANQQRILSAQIENAQTNLGTIFLPIVTKVMAFLNTTGIDILNNFTDKFALFAQPFVDFPDLLQKFGPANAIVSTLTELMKNMGIDVNAGPVVTFMTQLKEGITNVTEKVANWKTIFSDLMASAPVQNILDGFKGLSDFFTTQGPGILTIVQDLWDRLVKAFGPVMADVVLTMSEQFKKFGLWFQDNGPLITAAIKNIATAAGWIGEAIAKMWVVVKPLIDGLYTVVLGLVKTILLLITGDWAGAWEAFKQSVADAETAIFLSLIQFLNWIAGLFGSSLSQIGVVWGENWRLFVTILGQVWNNIVTTIEQKLNDVVTALVGAVTRFVQAGASWIFGIIQGINNSVIGISYAITNAISGLILGTVGIVKDFISVGTSIITTIRDGVVNTATLLGTGLVDAIGKGITAVNGKLSDFGRIGRQIITNLVDGIMGDGANVIDAIVSLIQESLDAVRTLLGLNGMDNGNGDTLFGALSSGLGAGSLLSSGVFGDTQGMGGMGFGSASGASGASNSTYNSRSSVNYYGPVTNTIVANQSNTDWLKNFR